MSLLRSIHDFMRRDTERFGFLAIRSKAIACVPVLVFSTIAELLKPWIGADAVMWIALAGLAMTVPLLLMYMSARFAASSKTSQSPFAWREADGGTNG